MKTRLRKYAKLRAACALLALLAGWMSQPVTLAATLPDVCSMACCVNEGHCCCKPSHRYVEGQVPAGGENVSASQLSAACPEGCAAPRYSSNLLLRDSARAAIAHAFSLATRLIHSHSTALAAKAVESCPSSPRAPPSVITSRTA
jgi:hypothetical protein